MFKIPSSEIYRPKHSKAAKYAHTHTDIRRRSRFIYLFEKMERRRRRISKRKKNASNLNSEIISCSCFFSSSIYLHLFRSLSAIFVSMVGWLPAHVHVGSVCCLHVCWLLVFSAIFRSKLTNKLTLNDAISELIQLVDGCICIHWVCCVYRECAMCDD